MPPINSHRNALNDNSLTNCVNETTHAHPMDIYITEETHLGQVTQNALNKIPTIAAPHIKQRRAIPIVPFKTIRQIGV